MVPAGDPTEQTGDRLPHLLEPGDTRGDGGNCMMVGGHEESVARPAPILDVLAPPDGWRHFGDAGAGHFVKMVHNGVEYGIMQAYAEGFELMYKSKFPIELKEVANLWMQGSVVRSWLLELAGRAFEQDGNDLEGIKGYVSDSGEGRWSIADGIDLDVPTPAKATTRTGCWRRCAASSAGTRSSARRAVAEPMAVETLEGTLENPLTEGLERLPVPPTALVIFGATGDLAHRKLLPALYNLAHEGALPDRFKLVGVARREKGHDDFATECRESIARYSRRPPDDQVLDGLLGHVSYVATNFDDPDGYRTLKGSLDQPDEESGQPLNRTYYLSTAPEFFPVIIEQLKQAGLHKGLQRGGPADVRCVIEKPFGTDLQSARELQSVVSSVFLERQVFRIDHYLGKETVQNVMAFRFANMMFEPVWNRNYIDQIQITAAEDIGIGTRAGYYDQAGALRDLVQNHMLQLVALTCMEPPASFDADKVRDEKVKVLTAITPPDPSDTVRAQYTAGVSGGEDVAGYLEEEGVPSDSHTE